MRHVIIRGFLSRKLRSSLTALAIILGVSMIVGSSVLTGQIKGAFDGIFLQARAATDVVITKKATFEDQGVATAPFDAALLTRVEAVQGVAHAVGAVQSSAAVVVVTVNGKPTPIRPTGGPALGTSETGAPFDTTTVLSGRRPAQSGEVALEERTAAKQHVKVGDSVVVATPNGVHPAKVVGIFSFAASVGGATQVVTTLADGQAWFDRTGQFDEIEVQVSSGLSPGEVKARIAKALPTFTVRTGPEQATTESAQIGSFVDIIGYVLIAIGVVSTLVGGFIIFNTFWITVGQRIRELALLRTLGASRGQIMRSVIAEAMIVGLIGSVAGIVAGLGIAKLILGLFELLGAGLPVGPMHLSAGVAILAITIGMGITLVASLIPAIRSTRIPPVAAIRDGATMPPGWIARHARFLAPIVAALGIAIVVFGLFGANGTAPALISVGGGALVLLIGVALTAPFAVPALARVIGKPGELFGGIPGRIGRENAERNPGRTAVTSAALMIGIFLVCFVAIFAASLQKNVTNILGSDIRAQFFVSAGGDGGNQLGLQPAIADEIRSIPGVASVSPTSFANARIDGTTVQVLLQSSAPTFPDAYRLRWVSGSDSVVRTLGPDQAVVDKDTADAQKLHVGSRIAVTTGAGVKATFVIAGIVESSQLVSGLLLSPAGYAPLGVNKGDAFMFVVVKPSVDQNALKATMEAAVTRANPLAQVQSDQDIIDRSTSQINGLVLMLYALLLVIVVISIVGIVNTLLLSVFERTREIGLLRAVGTTRWQVRWMVVYESVITSMIGAVLGVLVGVVFGALVLSRIKDLPFAMPVGQILIFFAAAIVAGILAAILPARRASRLNVLEALQYE